MYARTLAGRAGSTPPPGYAGTAFHPTTQEVRRESPDAMESRRHTPDEYGPSRPAVQETIRDPAPPTVSEEKKGHGPDASPLEALLSGLDGRVGAEEVVLLLVMLLLSADGAGVETLLLGVILLAGRGE